MIEMECPTCGKTLRIPVEYRGQNGKCNHCQGEIYVRQDSLTVAQKAALAANPSVSAIELEAVTAGDWRDAPATERQLENLVDLGATPSQLRNLTKSGASELIETLQVNGYQPRTVTVRHVYDTSPQAHPKNRAIYIVLALFLGAFGVHNFYAGRNGTAIAQLLVTFLTGWLFFPLLILGLWILVEMVVVDSDGKNVPFA